MSSLTYHFKEDLMIRLSLVSFSLLISLFVSFSLKAEVCEGIKSCSELYTKITGEKLQSDKSINKSMSISATGTDLDKSNVKKEFERYLNQNAVSLSNKRLQSMRQGEFLTAPIYLVSLGNMPMMINKDGLVTLVYQSTKETNKLVNSSVKKMLSKKKSKSLNKIIEFPKTNLIAVSDTYEYASKIMKEIMLQDKL